MDKVFFVSQAMESKLLVGGKNIIDHTNEQQKMLTLKRQQIAEQVRQHPRNNHLQTTTIFIFFNPIFSEVLHCRHQG